jgi:hypothetical protein
MVGLLTCGGGEGKVEYSRWGIASKKENDGLLGNYGRVGVSAWVVTDAR